MNYCIQLIYISNCKNKNIYEGTLLVFYNNSLENEITVKHLQYIVHGLSI